MSMWFTGEYRQVVANQRLVYTESMSDEPGDVMSPVVMGMPDGTTTEVTVELEDLDGRTRMTMTHAGIPADSPGAAGRSMALDKLTPPTPRRWPHVPGVAGAASRTAAKAWSFNTTVPLGPPFDGYAHGHVGVARD